VIPPQAQSNERSYAQAQPQVTEERTYTQAPLRQAPEPSYTGGSQYDNILRLKEEKEREYYDLVSKVHVIDYNVVDSYLFNMYYFSAKCELLFLHFFYTLFSYFYIL
jgi:hypothetical protein